MVDHHEEDVLDTCRIRILIVVLLLIMAVLVHLIQKGHEDIVGGRGQDELTGKAWIIVIGIFIVQERDVIVLFVVVVVMVMVRGMTHDPSSNTTVNHGRRSSRMNGASRVPLGESRRRRPTTTTTTRWGRWRERGGGTPSLFLLTAEFRQRQKRPWSREDRVEVGVVVGVVVSGPTPRPTGRGRR